MNTRTIRMTIDGSAVNVAADISVAAALLNQGLPLRRSVNGQWRAPVCGMGVCFECRVQVDGVPQQRACQLTVRDGMRVDTHG